MSKNRHRVMMQRNTPKAQDYEKLIQQRYEIDQQLQAIVATVNPAGLTRSQQDAARRGIHPGMYNEIDVMLMIDDAVANRDALWTKATDDLNQLGKLLFTIEDVIHSVDKRSLILRGDELIEALKATDQVTGAAAELAGLFTEIGIVFDRMGMLSLTEDLRARVESRVVGIRNLANGVDDGETLRQAALAPAEDTANQMLNLWRESVSINKGRTHSPITIILGSRADALINSGKTYNHAANEILKELSAYPEGTDEHTAWKELNSKAVGRDRNEYLRKTRHRWQQY